MTAHSTALLQHRYVQLYRHLEVTYHQFAVVAPVADLRVINNLFNRKFATFGTFFDTQSTVAVAIPNVLNGPLMVTPAQPLSIYVGMRVKL